MQKIKFGWDGESNIFELDGTKVFFRKGREDRVVYLATAETGEPLDGSNYTTGTIEDLIDLVNRRYDAELVLE